MPGVSKLAQGAWSWDPDFSGPGIILCWGGGASGESGQALTRGGNGGDSGWLCVDLQDFVSGSTGRVTGYNGAGGAQVTHLPGGAPSNPGEASYFGGGTTCKAPGGGDTTTVPQGRAKIPGGAGAIVPSADWNGGQGGDAPSQGAYSGGAGGVNGTQGIGTAGSVPGGGGSGGGQANGGDGMAGANGGCIIFPAPDATQPGYKLIGLDESYNFSAVGTYDDFVALGDGLAYLEAVGSGGGGRGGNSLQGGHGGSGGAWAYRLRQIFRDVAYRRVVPTGGTAGTYGALGNATSGGNGADASWSTTPLRIIQKARSGTVGTLWTCAPGSTTPQKVGFLVGEFVTIAGVDSAFNGNLEVKSVAADRLSFTVQLPSATLAPTAVTPAGTSVTLTTPIVLAKGGLGATANYNTGTPPAGGQASACIGDGAVDGGTGQRVRAGGAVNTTNGAGSGSGALPLGGDAVWGGGDAFNSTGTAVGDAGTVPGAGGGGGQGTNGGNAGVGARGAAVVRFILELNGIWVGEERKSVVRVKKWTGAPGSEVSHEASIASVWDGGVKRSSHRLLLHPESLKRRYPKYLDDKPSYKAFFDRETGCFNWKVGAPTMLAELADGDYDIVVFGDSVSEGWTSFDGVATGTADYPKAFPRFARDYLTTLVPGLAKGGTGMIRVNSVSGNDPEWTFSGWGVGTDLHYRTSNTIANVATFTPGMDTGGANGGTPQQITGNKGAVVYSGGGITVKDNSGNVLATGSATAGLGTLARLEFDIPGAAAGHILKINPTAAVTVNLFAASVYKTGIRVHNMSQGGAKAGGGTGQSYWGPASGMTAPGNMTMCYTQSVMVASAKGQPECYLIFLGGNDSNAGTDAATIKAAFKRIVDQIQSVAPTADIVLMPDVWTPARALALMDLCMEEDVAMIDFFYLSRGLSEIFGRGYNGDVFGHLNAATGAPWAGGMLRDALLHDPS